MADSKRYEDYGNPTLQQGGWLRTGEGNNYVEYTPEYSSIYYNRICTLEYVPQYHPNQITIAGIASKELEVSVLVLRSDNYIIAPLGWQENGYTFNLGSTYDKLGVMFRFKNEDTITPNDVTFDEVGAWLHSLRKLTTATDTITTLPADLYADGNNATIGISGNTVQNGTPTPDNPIMPQECGERTGNLCPMIFSHTGVVDDVGAISSYYTRLWSDKIPVSASQSYYVVIDGTASNDEELSFNRIIEYDANGVFISRINVVNLTSTSFTTSANCRYVVLDIRTRTLTVNISVSDINTLMLNEGSTALPYEPYGYKIPILSGGTTTPVYLGQVQSTRNIGKLVLTGQESVFSGNVNDNTVYFGFGSLLDTFGLVSYYNRRSINSHTITATAGNNPQSLNYVCAGFNPASNYSNTYYMRINFSTIGVDSTASVSERQAAFKSWLAAQYAAGTPVTVWYVLATPETGIVNEPLMKIGDYADTVSGITIPTIAGKDTFDVQTTLKPSEVSLSYTGWHDATVKERDGSQWNE